MAFLGAARLWADDYSRRRAGASRCVGLRQALPALKTLRTVLRGWRRSRHLAAAQRDLERAKNPDLSRQRSQRSFPLAPRDLAFVLGASLLGV